MGYDIHLTRRVRWSDDGEPFITLDEWQSVVQSDPLLEALPSTPDNPLTAMMSGPRGTTDGARYFYYSTGEIFVKNPNKPALTKLIEIARRLDARVVGDDGETYGEDGAPDRAVSYTVGDSW